MLRRLRIASWSLPLGLLGLVGCSGRVSLEKETEMLHDIRARREAYKPVDQTMHSPAMALADAFTRPTTVREVAAEALGRIGIDAVPALVKALSYPDADMRAEAADALAIIGPKAEAAVPALTRLLSDPDENVRRSAAQALGQIGPAAEGAVPSLLKLMEESGPPPASAILHPPGAG